METSKPIKYIPCFLCFNSCPIKYSKRNKPYFICDNCGIQVFIRRENGIKRFDELIQDLNNSSIHFSDKLSSSFELISLTNKLAQLNRQLEEIENKKGMFDFVSPNPTLELAATALKNEMRQIHKKLERK